MDKGLALIPTLLHSVGQLVLLWPLPFSISHHDLWCLESVLAYVFVKDLWTDSHQDFLHLVGLKSDIENI